MSFTSICPDCERYLTLPETSWGLMVRCPLCASVFVPGADFPETAVERSAGAHDDQPARRLLRTGTPPQADAGNALGLGGRPVPATAPGMVADEFAMQDSVRSILAPLKPPLGAGWARFVMVLLVLCAAVELVRILMNAVYLPLVGVNPRLSVSGPVLMIMLMFTFAHLLVVAITFVSLLAWLYLVHQNLDRFQVRGRRFTPASAVGWCLVPFANLVKPYWAMQELWRASAPDAPSDKEDGWRANPRSTLLFTCWMVSLAGAIVGAFSVMLRLSLYIDSRASTGQVWSALVAEMVFSVCCVLNYLILMDVIQQVRTRQKKKWASIRRKAKLTSAP